MWSEASDLPVNASFVWGYLGAVAVPLVALAVTYQARMAAWKTLAIVFIVTAAYAVGSVLALCGIITIEFLLNPSQSGWD